MDISVLVRGILAMNYLERRQKLLPLLTKWIVGSIWLVFRVVLISQELKK